MPAPQIHTRKYASAFVRLKGRVFENTSQCLARCAWLAPAHAMKSKAKSWCVGNLGNLGKLGKECADLDLSLPSLPPLSKSDQPRLPAKATGMLCQLFAASDFPLRRQMDSKCSAALRAHAKQGKVSGKLKGFQIAPKYH